jgi:hypothetical protein
VERKPAGERKPAAEPAAAGRPTPDAASRQQQAEGHFPPARRKNGPADYFLAVGLFADGSADRRTDRLAGGKTSRQMGRQARM